ncbi:putative mitochondrial respiratory complex I chaperone (Cia84) [Aspergillus alliaceus]|uniref:putative mitochondrial respiratory complex I chaperone (Cia84) n=1 Tax=Petromyces alliaceus TaxID=209559 RepID=UPI0012A5E666|nr:uncharacterized protein BDW43DRAFT_313833 [Aspergillus alliaceus]KAB8230573.1 hypothetical protein BDW43DRAFT_313833 [Aspergillus alliaceus]
MQAHLTRRVFRAILNNEPLSSSQCRHRLLHTLRTYRSQGPIFSRFYHLQRRGFFARNVGPSATPQPATLPSEAGLKPMSDLMRAMRDKSRGPANSVLAKAFQDFFVARAVIPGVITGFQARLLLVTWKHLRANESDLESEDWQLAFSTENLENVLFVLSLARCLPESREVIQRLARYVFLELCADHGYGANHIGRPALIAYINIQALNGNPEGARHVVEKFWNRLCKTNPSPWLTVLKGFAINGDRRLLRRTTESLHDYGVKFDPASHQEVLRVLIDHDLLAAVKIMYECPLFDGRQPTLATKEAVIKYAILHSEMAWAEPIFKSLSQRPITETMGITLLWEAAHGKDASAITEKVRTLIKTNPEAKSSLTIECVNNLIAYANFINNPQLSAEYAALISHWGLHSNIQSRLLKLESYIQAGDVERTLSHVQDLHDINDIAIENMPLMNKLITMICLSGQGDALFDQISSVLDPLFENNVHLEPETLAALTHMLIYRRDWEGVSDLLRPRLASYDDEGRSKIRKALTKFILDLSQDSAGAWEAYGLLQLAFPETSVSTRTEIMTAFYKRNRSDLAYLIFGHMRQAEDFARRPKPDTYTKCFRWIARTHDTEHLVLVHNMLKLDVEVDLNTKLLNGLMHAYAACNMPEKSMEVFRQILQSDEGPTHKTVAIFFKLCEKHHNGAQEAIKMMEKVKLLEIEVDRRLYMAYVEALAAQCEFDLAIEAIDKMHSETGYMPNHNSIGLLYNAVPYQYWKDEVEKWAKEKYPELWAQLNEIERTEEEEGLRFNITGYEIVV